MASTLNNKSIKLSRRLEDAFPLAIRQSGQNFYWQHLLRISGGTADSVQAEIVGVERFGVTFVWDEPFLSVWCDCPQFAKDDNPCKHLWATILAAEAQGYLADVTNATEVIIELGDESGEDEDEDEDDEETSRWGSSRPNFAKSKTAEEAPPKWREDLAGLLYRRSTYDRYSEPWPAKRQLLYRVDVQASIASSGLVLAIETHDRKMDGSYSVPNQLNMKLAQVRTLPDDDREIMSMLAGGLEYHGWGHPDQYRHLSSSNLLTPSLASAIVPLAIKTGRCFLRKPRQAAAPAPLTWDDGEPWSFELEMKQREITGWAVGGVLRRGGERVALRDAALITDTLVFMKNRAGRMAKETRAEWINHFRTNAIAVSEKDCDAFIGELVSSAGAPPLAVPEELKFEEVSHEPRRLLKMRAGTAASQARVVAELQFEYGGVTVAGGDRRRGIYAAEPPRRFLKRHAEIEQAAMDELKQCGLRAQTSYEALEGTLWQLHANKVPATVRRLIEAGWHVEAEGKIFRRPGNHRMEVASGVDWFELRGEVEFGDTSAQLPELLAAVRRGETTVALGDGTFGLVPEEWLKRIGLIAGLGAAAEDGHIRFKPNQAGLLDALLAAQPEMSCDEAFSRVRASLKSFEGVKAAEQPDGFVGQLRDYQREGLGWMEFLRKMSFGGCLADDMGVGKTAQVLALLETRRELRAKGELHGPSLVVAPRSLIFNWQEEAARFTPQLRVLDHTGAERGDLRFDDYDVVLTTYGTLRRDAPRLKDFAFDYLVLDEAQAVKNSGTESAKAVRLLRGSHRLALSGTPVENHLGELFSLFEFLNPGMLNTSGVFKLAGGSARNLSEESLLLLAQALRPFILRRTKEQVARELPPKTEQTIFCELKPEQRKLYNELRQHYRSTLLGKIQKDGLAKSKIQVLEALLRLRQAACHPALIDVKRSGEASAKLDVLLNKLNEVLAEGHKALVFSQFTSLLKIVREHLDKEGTVYEYLDGCTNNRQAPVERFQTDPNCKLFLISLKAGGLGLNLTAAGYVFLLDPWWNPAVEAQAVDRAHRIGQTQQVFAYRLIAKDTVEEKVLELQKTKRDLATAIISADNSLIKNLQREDLELLLS